jgi:protein-disulfide isomerase
MLRRMRLAIALGIVLAATSARAAPAEGPANAPITITGWTDFACGYCSRVRPTLDALDKKYPAQIRWVHRTLPLDEDNTLAAEASYAAAAQGRYRAMSDRLFAVRGNVDRAAVESIARELGLDLARFRAALDAQTYRRQIEADVRAARKLGVRGAPTFFINGHRLAGNQPLEAFVHVVDEVLAVR